MAILKNIQPVEGERLSCRGEKLFTVRYTPTTTTRAVLIFSHGYAEHVGRYSWAFPRIAAAGIAVHAFDAHGHGRSGSKKPQDRAYIQSYTHMVDDVEAFVHDVTAEYPADMPIFLGGRSMGGLMTLHAVLRGADGRARGVVVTSVPAGIEFTPILRFQAMIGGILGLLVPRWRIIPAVRPAFMSSDAAVATAYENDPLNFVGNMRARTGNEMLKAVKAMQAHGKDLALPVLALHGAQDKIARLSAARVLFEGCASKDKTFIELPKGWHDLWHGPGREDTVDCITNWILTRCD